MRTVIQRVTRAKVEIDGKTHSQIQNGLLVYLSVGPTDSHEDVKFIAEKITSLRIFADSNGKMNKSIIDTAGEILLISNFTLHADMRKGNRPSFDTAAEPAEARKIYEYVIEQILKKGVPVKTGLFGAPMHIESINDGPVTFILDSSRLF